MPAYSEMKDGMGIFHVHTANQMRIKNMKGMVTIYSFKVLRTRHVKTGYFFDINTKEL